MFVFKMYSARRATAREGAMLNQRCRAIYDRSANKAMAVLPVIINTIPQSFRILNMCEKYSVPDTDNQHRKRFRQTMTAKLTERSLWFGVQSGMNVFQRTARTLTQTGALFVCMSLSWSASASPLKKTIDALDTNPQEIERTIRLHESIAARRSSLSGDVVENTLQKAQENLIRKKPELAYRQLVRLTLAQGFTTHPGRAAVYHWMGRSLVALDMPNAAMENFAKSLDEHRQTPSARLSTLMQVALINPKLDDGVAERYYQQALALSKDRLSTFRTYPFCKLLYHNQAMKLAGNASKKSPLPNTIRVALFLQAVIAIKGQRLREATTKLEKSLSLSRRNASLSVQKHDDVHLPGHAGAESPPINTGSWGVSPAESDKRQALNGKNLTSRSTFCTCASRSSSPKMAPG